MRAVVSRQKKTWNRSELQHFYFSCFTDSPQLIIFKNRRCRRRTSRSRSGMGRSQWLGLRPCHSQKLQIHVYGSLHVTVLVNGRNMLEFPLINVPLV